MKTSETKFGETIGTAARKLPTENMTYGELRKILPTTGRCRPPSAKSLMETGLVLFTEEVYDARITVYANGFYRFRDGGRETVFAVDRCRGIEADVFNGDGRKTVLTISDEDCDRMAWYWPLWIMGSRRLDRNQENREENRVEIHLDPNTEEWENCLRVEDFTEQLFAEEDEDEDEPTVWERVNEALQYCTERQRTVVELYFSRRDMTERKVAELLTKQEGESISQQAVHQLLTRALNRMIKYFR